MREIELNKMVSLQGGDAVDDFCTGFAIASGVLIIGAELNFWNPVGWIGGTVIAVVGIGCAIA